MPQFFRVTDNLSLPGRWHLKSPLLPSGKELDPRAFTQGQAVDVPLPLRLPLRKAGRPLDFTLADFGMPVAVSALATRLDELAPGALQRIPIIVEGHSASYEVLNLLRTIQCLDEQATKIEWWQPIDGRPDKVGQYKTVIDEVIDASKVAAEQIFRLAGWRTIMICTERVRLGASMSEFAGLEYHPVGVSDGAT